MAALAKAGLRPVLYNSDATWIWRRGPQRFERKHLEQHIEELAETAVSIFSHCVYARGQAHYPSKVAEWFGGEVQRFNRSHHWILLSNFRRLVAEGNDPLTVLCEAAHRNGMKFLACLRMNDRHPPSPENAARFVLENQEQLGMKRSDGSLIGGLDFQHEEVRDYIFACMEEMVRDFDSDGLELDWMRWCLMFSETVPQQRRIEIMTEYHRRIRAMLDEVGRRKGKKLLLSLRVPQVIEECEQLGFDVRTYVQEGVIDILCPSDFFHLDANMPVDEFKALTEGTGVLLMPSLHPGLGQQNRRLATSANQRAAAHSYYAQGADGISLYNWFVPFSFREDYDYDFMREIGEPALLALEERLYHFGPLWGGEAPTGYEHDHRTTIPRDALERRHAFRFRIKEDLARVSASLQFKLESLTVEDEVMLDINGEALEAGQYRLIYPGWFQREEVGWPLEPFFLCEIDEATPLLCDGDNEIGVRLKKRNQTLDCPIRVVEVEVSIKPRSSR